MATLSATARARIWAALPAPVPPQTSGAGALIRAYQRHAGLQVDGIAGPRTLSSLWRACPPQAAEVVDRALAALGWPRVTYAMGRNTGLGEGWLQDPDDAPETGDCSDFACHCLGVPKDQTRGLAGTVVRGEVWLGADAIGSGALGPLLPLGEARPGDLVVYAGQWERGERVAIGHVEVCVEARDDGRVWTVGCASSNRPSAIKWANKTAMWRKKGAIAVRPRWYSEGA